MAGSVSMCSAQDCGLPAMGYWYDYGNNSILDLCPGHFCGFALEVMHAMEEAQSAAAGEEPGTEAEAQAVAHKAHRGGRARPRVMAVDDPPDPVVEEPAEDAGEAGKAG